MSSFTGTETGYGVSGTISNGAGVRGQGAYITDEHLRHLSPPGWEHIFLTGVYRWNLDAPPRGSLRRLRA
jgi:hypothetical protein